MKKGIVCSLCKDELVLYQRDHRLGSCEKCNIYRCGWCGGILSRRFTYYKKGNLFLSWAFPPRIVDLFGHDAPYLHCAACGRTYPLKQNFFWYLFWEGRALSWRIKEWIKGVNRRWINRLKILPSMK